MNLKLTSATIALLAWLSPTAQAMSLNEANQLIGTKAPNIRFWLTQTPQLSAGLKQCPQTLELAEKFDKDIEHYLFDYTRRVIKASKVPQGSEEEVFSLLINQYKPPASVSFTKEKSFQSFCHSFSEKYAYEIAVLKVHRNQYSLMHATERTKSLNQMAVKLIKEYEDLKTKSKKQKI